MNELIICLGKHVEANHYLALGAVVDEYTSPWAEESNLALRGQKDLLEELTS